MKKISIIAAVVLAAIISSCGNGTPKANMKSDVDSLCYAIGMAQSQGLKDYLVMRMGVDTTYLNEFIKGLNEGANAGDDKKMQAYFAAKDWVPRVDPHHIYRGHVAVDAIIAEIEPKPYRPKFFEVIRNLGYEIVESKVRVYGSVQP